MPWGMKKKFKSWISSSTEQEIGCDAEQSCASIANASAKPQNSLKNQETKHYKQSKLNPPSSQGIAAIKLQKLTKVLKDLECPICFNTCIPPIIPCINGHIICSACQRNIHRCPTCCEGFSKTRNLFAEQVIGQYSLGCKYAKEGCKFLKWKGDNMSPHEIKCYYRNVQCPVPSCQRGVRFNGQLAHMIDVHKICGVDQLPVLISYDAEKSLTSNLKWLPYYIKAYDCIFYVMMEIIRPHFWAWIYVHCPDKEQNDSTIFQGTITFVNHDKDISTEWKGPVYNIRTPGNKIIEEGLCFSGPELLMQHFEKDGLISICVNIEKRAKSDPTPPPEIAFPFLKGTIQSQASVMSIASKPSSRRSSRSRGSRGSSTVYLIHHRNQNNTGGDSVSNRGRSRSRSRSYNSSRGSNRSSKSNLSLAMSGGNKSESEIEPEAERDYLNSI